MPVEALHEARPEHALSEEAWFPLGLPPRQVDVGEAFSKTWDAVRLVEVLMKRCAAGEPVSGVVANTAINIELELARKYPDLTELERKAMAAEQRRLLGLKERIFWETIQHFVITEAIQREKESESIQTFPILLMSDFESSEEFFLLYKDVSSLFDDGTHPEFAEAVYVCVPDCFRPRRHRTETYAELHARNGEQAATMRARCQYVLYQIAMVLFVGGKKLGHEGERVYDAATCLARDLLGEHRAIHSPLTFEIVSVPDATGHNFYRAGRGLEAARQSDAFSSYVSFQDYLNAHVPEMQALSERLDSLNDLQYDLNRAILAALSSGELTEDLVASLQARHVSQIELFQRELLKSLKRIKKAQQATLEIQEARVCVFRKILHTLIEASPALNHDDDRQRIRDAFLDQDVRESLLSRAQPPNYRELFLLKRSGLMAALKEEMPVEELATTIPRWLPCRRGSAFSHEETRFLMEGTLSLLYRDGDRDSVNWMVDRSVFDAALFSDWVLHPPMRTLQDRINIVFAAPFNLFEKIKWEALDSLLHLIEDTPLEAVYQRWLTALQGESVSEPMPSLPIDPELRTRIEALFETRIFNDDFQQFFRKAF